MRFLKNLSKLVNFCVPILAVRIEENTQHFLHIMLYYFKKCKKATEMQKKMCAVYGVSAVTDRMCQSGLRSCVLEISLWTILHD